MGAVGAGTGSAKLILFGEHAAVHGHPAVGIQLPEKTTVRIGPPRDGPWDLGAAPPEDREGLLRLLGRLESLVPEAFSEGRGPLSVESSVARGVGMGSSAGLCVALATAALARTGLARTGLARTGAPHDDERVWSVAHALEGLYHGAPSGIDTGLSLRAGVSAFFPRAPQLPRVRPLAGASLILVVSAVPRTGDTAALVRGIGERVRAGDAATRERLEKLGGIARAAIDALGVRGEDAGVSIGKLAGEAMGELRALGLSSPALDLLLQECLAAGALGGKLSGAGGGGAFYLVAASSQSAADICRVLAGAAERAGISFAVPPRVIETSSPP